ncbi:MAG: hypothetical protein KC420_12860, partial [Myxococcales bacterium]|nr:hypothetical protein [Myxococcales bacterium]
SGTDSTSTTGDELCYFGTTGNSGGADGPWLELYHQGAALQEGGVLRLECGFQGSYMFEVVPVLGGFTPLGKYVHFEVALDVEGHTEGPLGHFFYALPYDILVGCIEDPNYDDPSFFPTSFQMQVHDEVANLLALDGLPAHLHVGFTGDGMSVEIDLDLTISAAPDDSWAFCGYEDTGGTTTDGTTGGTDGTTTDGTTGGTTGP